MSHYWGAYDEAVGPPNPHQRDGATLAWRAPGLRIHAPDPEPQGQTGFCNYSVQCWCGRYAISVEPWDWKRALREGVECSSECRRTYQSKGVMPNGANEPPDWIKRKVASA